MGSRLFARLGAVKTRGGVLRTAFLLAAFAAAPAAHAALGLAVTLTGDTSTGTINPGETTSLRIELTNSSTLAAITGVTFDPVLTLPGAYPDGLKISGAFTYACSDANGPVAELGTLTANIGSNTISLTGGSIPAQIGGTNGQCTIDIPVTAGTTTGAQKGYDFIIDAGRVKGTDGAAVSNPSQGQQTITVREMARPTLAKSFGANSIYLGGTPTTLQLKVTNPAAAKLTGFGVTDNLPENIELVSPQGVGYPAVSCTGTGAVNPTVDVTNASKVVLSGGTLAAGGDCTVTVQVKGKSTNGNHSWQQANQLFASDFVSDIGLKPVSNATPRNITVTSPLAVRKQVGGASQILLSDGQTESFVIRLTNNGTAPLEISNFTDDPIDGTTAGNSNSYGLKVEGTLTATCSGGGVPGAFSATANNTGVMQTSQTTIAAGGHCDITIPFRATVETPGTPATRTNTLPAANITTTTSGVVSEAVSASVIVADDLRVVKSVSPSGTPGVVAGSAVRYSVTVQNFATAPVNNVTIADPFTHGQTFITGTIDGVDYTPTLSGTGCSGLTVGGTSTEPTFTVGTLPGRSSSTTPGACTVSFYAKTADNGTAAGNVIPAGNVCYSDGGSGNKCNGGASTTVTPSVQSTVVSATKGYDKTSPQQEGTVVRATITVNNWTSRPLAMAIADNLPQATSGGQMRVANPANAVTTCGGTPVITAVPDTTSVGMDDAIVPARGANGTAALPGSCTLQVNVVAGAGNYTEAASNRHNAATVSYTAKRMDGNTSTGSVVAKADFVFDSALCSTANPCTKTFEPTNVSSGGKSTVKIRLVSSGAMALNNVSVTDPLPSGMVLATPPNAYTTCAGPTAITAVAGASTVGMTGATIAGNANCDLVFDVIATGTANWVNTIPAGNINADGGIGNQSPVAGTLVYGAPSEPMVSKSVTPGSLTFPGQVSQLEVVITNGTTAVTNLSLTDHFTLDGTPHTAANGMVIAATPAASTTCPGGIVAATPGGTSVSVSGVNLAASASCKISVNVSSNRVGTVINSIPARAITTDQGISNGVGTSTSLATSANLGITKQFMPNVIKPGENSRLRITLLNPTTKLVSNLSVTDALPGSVVVAAVPNPSNNCSGAAVTASGGGATVQISGGSLPAGASCWAEVDVTAAAQGDYTNTIPAGGLTGTVDGGPVSNPQPTTDILHVKAPLTVHKAFANAAPAGNRTLDAGNPVGFATGTASQKPGTEFVLTIRLDNANNAALTGAGFTDTLPEGLVVATTPGAATTCAGGTVVAQPSAKEFRLTGATIPGTGFCTVTLNVLSNIPGSYTNTIGAGGVTTNEGVINENPTNAKVIISSPPTVAKQFDPAVIPPNGTSKLTIFLNNANAEAITLTSAFTDTLPTLPGNIVVSNLPNASTTCRNSADNADATVNATAGGSTVGLSANSKIPPGGCKIEVNVTGNTAGTHTNTIPAGALKTNVGDNPGPADAPLAISTAGYISGKVFRDNDNAPDSVFNNADTPIAGQTIVLRNGADCTGSVAGTTTTDAAGNYLFSGLAAGTYSVCQPDQPAGTMNATPVPGAIQAVNGSTGNQGTASNPTTTSSRIANIVLNGNGSGGEVSGSTGNNFPEVPRRSVSGRVFLDYNNNGVLNGSDHGIGGVTIQLKDSGGTVIRTTTTDAEGNYRFDDLPAGTYTVFQPGQPDGTANGTPTAGSTGGTASNPVATTSQVLELDLTGAKTASTGNNFAEIPDAPDLTIGKTHSPGSFVAGSDTGYYTIVPRNIGPKDTSGQITVVDDLPAGITAKSASGTGWACTVLTAQKVSCTTNAVITANGGTGNSIVVNVAVASAATGTLTNVATISGGGEPPGFDGNNKTEDPTPIIATAGAASLSGHVWRDDNHDRVMDSGEQKVPGWTVELLHNGVLVATTVTDAAGKYAFTNLPPGSGYQVRFKNPDSGAVWGSARPNEGGAPFTNGTVDPTTNPTGADARDGTLKNLTLNSGVNYTEHSLPLDPAGVVYDAVTRQPVQGAVVTITGPGGFNPAVHLVGGAASVTTGADGQYQFLLQPGAPAGTYTLAVTTYPAGYLPQPSDIIPVCNGTLNVTGTQGGAFDPVLVQNTPAAPGAGVADANPAACPGLVAGGSPTTQYYFSFDINVGTSANVLNNHIPLDPILGSAIRISKTTPMMNVTRGDLVPYTITATNTLGSTLPNIDVQDQLPPGFKYRSGSASLNGVYVEPKVAGRQVTWANQIFAPNEKKTYKLILVVGAGVGEGEYVNQAWALNSIASSRVSNVGTATVRVVPDPTFDCSDIIGKVFDDKNANGYQDQGEPGIPNVRVATARGLLVTTDAEGRFHVPCAAIPQMDRGSNFVMKLDDRTLPSGFRVTTENPRDVRVTRGKMVKLNFGATVHRVMRVELDGRAFAADKNALLPEWQARLPDIVKSLQERPSVLRLAYRAGNGDEQGKQRLKALAEKLGDLYQEERKRQSKQKPADGADDEVPEIPPLIVETEIFKPVGEGK